MKIWNTLCRIEAAMPNSLVFWTLYGVMLGTALHNLAAGLALGIGLGSARRGRNRIRDIRDKDLTHKAEAGNARSVEELIRADGKVDSLQLYYFGKCPYCIKVRLALWWMNVEIPKKNILSNPGYKAELIAGGGKKQVPCLRIEMENHEVHWLYESDDIIRYLKQTAAK